MEIDDLKYKVTRFARDKNLAPSACYQPLKVPENQKTAINNNIHGNINFVVKTSSRTHFKDNFT